MATNTNGSTSSKRNITQRSSRGNSSGSMTNNNNNSSNSETTDNAVVSNNKIVKHKRRFCRMDGCNRIVKSQGLCQRHGAKPRKCKVEGCKKQAQGNFDGMCKSHFKAHRRKHAPLPPVCPHVEIAASAIQQAAINGSATITTGTTTTTSTSQQQQLMTMPLSKVTSTAAVVAASPSVGASTAAGGVIVGGVNTPRPSGTKMVTIPLLPPPAEGNSVYDEILPASIAFRPNGKDVMPLVSLLKAGFDSGKPSGWHRNEERRSRGLWPIENAATQLEGWERELVWNEILLLSGTPEVSFRHLARAWGRDKGFHMVLAQFICDRYGDVERKKRKKGASSHKTAAAAATTAVTSTRSRTPLASSNAAATAIAATTAAAAAAAAAAGGTVARAVKNSQPASFDNRYYVTMANPATRGGQTSKSHAIVSTTMGTMPHANLITGSHQKPSSSLPITTTGAAICPGNKAHNHKSVSADVWDDACYGGSAYNEALAVGLFAREEFSNEEEDEEEATSEEDDDTYDEDYTNTLRVFSTDTDFDSSDPEAFSIFDRIQKNDSNHNHTDGENDSYNNNNNNNSNNNNPMGQAKPTSAAATTVYRFTAV